MSMNCIVILCDTLRRDHCGPYHRNRPLNEVTGPEQPDWVVPTPNLDRLAARGTVFDQAWCGSTPCMPARRDIQTGRYEFLERGWGPLEEDDRDLPRQISGTPNLALSKQLSEGRPVSYFVTDHFHLWEQGSGNYHMGYTGFDFIRGQESDNWKTDPIAFPVPDKFKVHKDERHYRNIDFIRRDENDWFAPLVFNKAAEWLEANHSHESFYVHIDCFDPHEPWDPPQRLVDMFPAHKYEFKDWIPRAPYDKWEPHMNADQLRHVQALYAAEVVLVDEALGKLLDTMDRLDLWKNTMLIFTTDHGTYNGDHGRTGKMQTHQHDAVAHIPFIVYHPEFGHGQRREQLVQLVDIYPTVLNAMGRPCPDDIHGIDLTPVLKDSTAQTREYAITGMFGKSTTITDGQWILHQSPVEGNQPLYWYGHCLAKFIKYPLGEYKDGRREVRNFKSWPVPTWLSNKIVDPNEYDNLVEQAPDKLIEMQTALRKTLLQLKAPSEQLQRLGI